MLAVTALTEHAALLNINILLTTSDLVAISAVYKLFWLNQKINPRVLPAP